MKARLLMFAVAAVTMPAATPQAPSPQFEVATVKRLPPDESLNINLGINTNLGSIRNGRVTLNNARLCDCLRFAYSIPSDKQLAGPDWIFSSAVRFDVVGLGPAMATRDELLAMLQALLAERLKLVVRREKRELSFLALVVGTNLKIQDTTTVPAAPNLRANSAGPGRISGSQMSLPMLANLLSRFEYQTVVDMTGLPGFFDIHLEWTSDDAALSEMAAMRRKAEGRAVAVNLPSLHEALRQLGLKLESRKGPLDVLIVARAEQTPIEN